MSERKDEKPKSPRLPEEKLAAVSHRLGLTLEEIDEFFRASGWANYRCEVCGGENFQLSLFEGYPVPLSLYTAASSTHALWAIHVTCNTCANLKLLSVPKLRELTNKPVDGGE
jgi:hypothetical protein